MATLFVDKLDPQSGTALEIGTSGDTVTVPSGATFNVAGTLGSGLTNTPNFAAIKDDGQQSITTSTYTKCTLNSVTFDTASGWDATNNRWVVPSGEAGKYNVFASLETYCGSNDETVFLTQVRKNGSSFIQAQHQTMDDGNRHFFHSLNYILDLAVDDYLELWAFITGTSPTIRGDSPNTFMAISKLIE